MIYRTLGRTNIQMPILGMGSGGGPDPLGQASGKPEREVHALIRRAFDLGITYFDTSPGYMESEAILGRALKSFPRDDLILSTKIALAGIMPDESVSVMQRDEIVDAVDLSLKRLQTDYLDIMLMAVAGPEFFDVVVNEHIPVLQELQRAGKIRFLGSSELSRDDGSHEWLQRLLPHRLSRCSHGGSQYHQPVRPGDRFILTVSSTMSASSIYSRCAGYSELPDASKRS